MKPISVRMLAGALGLALATGAVAQPQGEHASRDHPQARPHHGEQAHPAHGVPGRGAAQEAHRRPEPAHGASRGGRPEPAHGVPHGARPQPSFHGEGHLDQRYHHDRYYPSHGAYYAALPPGTISIGYRGGRWYFHGGVWWRPAGTRFVVVAPPYGIVVPYLPAGVVTLWIAGTPYYYANDIYYAAAPGGYAVVEPPAGAGQALAAPSFVIYPREGQDSAQIEADRAACNDWAGAQAGIPADASLFQRAFEACMDGRGYSVR